MVERCLIDILKAVASGVAVSGIVGLILYLTAGRGAKAKASVYDTGGAVMEPAGVDVTRKKRNLKTVILTFCVVVVLVSVLLLIQPLSVKITDPGDSDVVPLTRTITGTISGYTAPGEYLWVVVNPASSPGSYWPQDRPISPWEGSWSSLATFGNASTSGQKFYIYVITVNEKDNQYYTDYMKDNETTKAYPGIALPASAKKLARIAVIRD